MKVELVAERNINGLHLVAVSNFLVRNLADPKTVDRVLSEGFSHLESFPIQEIARVVNGRIIRLKMELVVEKISGVMQVMDFLIRNRASSEQICKVIDDCYGPALWETKDALHDYMLQQIRVQKKNYPKIDKKHTRRRNKRI